MLGTAAEGDAFIAKQEKAASLERGGTMAGTAIEAEYYLAKVCVHLQTVPFMVRIADCMSIRVG
jgi:hypothetical protein